MYIETLVFRQNSFLLNSRNHHCMGFVPNRKVLFQTHLLFMKIQSLRNFEHKMMLIYLEVPYYPDGTLSSNAWFKLRLFLSIIPFKTHHSQVELQLLNPIVHSPVRVEKNTHWSWKTIIQNFLHLHIQIRINFRQLHNLKKESFLIKILLMH